MSLVNLKKTGWDSDGSLWPGRTHQILAPIFFCLQFLSQFLPFFPFTYTHTCMCVHAHTHTHTHTHMRTCFKAPKRGVLCIRIGSWAKKKGNLSYSKSGVPNSERRRREGVDYRRIFPASLLTLFIIFSVFVYDSY